jgi:hypothetical protein
MTEPHKIDFFPLQFRFCLIHVHYLQFGFLGLKILETVKVFFKHRFHNTQVLSTTYFTVLIFNSRLDTRVKFSLQVLQTCKYGGIPLFATNPKCP